MKILFISLFLLGSGATPMASAGLNRVNSYKTNQKRVHIDITLTSKEGCKFRIVGNYNTWTGNFTGTVTASGKDGCPKGTFTFGLAVQDDGTANLYGDKLIVKVFKSDPDMLEGFITYLKTM
ncbi:hypothetical protein D3C87_278240 [compost metagenome]